MNILAWIFQGNEIDHLLEVIAVGYAVVLQGRILQILEMIALDCSDIGILLFSAVMKLNET